MPDALLIPTHADFPQAVATLVIDAFRTALPDLSALTLVVPQPVLAPRLREALLAHTGGALLMPRLLTLHALAAPLTPPATALACRLRLAEALSRFRFLFEGQTPLRVADALYSLFDELERESVALPADEAALAALMQTGYGAAEPLAALSREAGIVHHLHKAFRDELGEAAPAVAQRRALFDSLQSWPASDALWFVGIDALNASEAAAIRPLLARPNVRCLLQGRLAGRDGAATRRLLAQLGVQPLHHEAAATGRGRWLDAGLADEGLPLERAEVVRGERLDLGDLAITAANDPEHEAQCADLAVREALLAGARRVAVVCNNRRLARRLRARLERAGVALTDANGWALATSRAAAALDAWLDCVEQDFPFRALLALLKSGFVADGTTWADALEPALYRQQIAGGAERIKATVPDADTARFARLLHAARAVQTLAGTHAASRHADGLLESLKRLGLDEAFAADAAGARVLARVQELGAALGDTALQLHWRAFRSLVDTALEDASFPSPAASDRRVQLLTLDQTQGLAADAVVLTGVTAALLHSGHSPFFNSGVRRELGLPSVAEAQALSLARLRRVLEAAPRVRLLYAPERPGEDAEPAAPLQALIAFGAAAGCPLQIDAALAARAPQAEIATETALPAPARRAAPPAPAALLARALSARGHQALIDCPYRFHARYGLGLERWQEPDAPVDQSDYGERVHRILHAFETPLEGLPPPWTGARDASQLAAMTEHLCRIAAAVFAADLAARPLARFWQQAFARAAPWLAERLASWPGAATAVETDLEATREGWRLVGRADRIDRRTAEARVVDYKTGQSPAKAEMLAGEAVQLPHYALLGADIATVEYWNLKEEKTVAVGGEDLEALLPAMTARLGTLAAGLERGAPLPAHGAERVCAYCEYLGVCRKADLA